MKLDPLNNYRQFDPRIQYRIEFIDLALKKLFVQRIDHKFHDIFDDIETFCMFIGYPRSGHTLTGSLLDAHPDAIIAHELDVLKYIEAGFTKKQIFYLILKNSSTFTKAGRKWAKYSYQVPNQWNGRFRKLKVIGDKKGGKSTRRFSKNPKLVESLNSTIDDKKIKLIHVYRNPYDNITTISKKHFNNDLRRAIDFYFSYCKTIDNLKTQFKNIIDIKHESFIEDPKNCLKKICGFLELDAPTNYLDDSSSIVFASPRKRRFGVHWSSEYIKIVRKRIDEFDYLKGYSFRD